ncbi:hypothetical protein ACFT9I_21640 [Streptomyces sp. NPDC057137]|uniref:hypothetical protein n=1 Tax=Streptomyces sp. NPDC057137 TaxID=3346030 RepID=UPI00362A3A3D
MGTSQNPGCEAIKSGELMLDQFRRGWIDPPSGQSHDISAPSISAAIPGRPADQHSLLGLAAFVQLHRPDYLRYARARLVDETASRAAVEAAITAVGGRWSDFLRNARPTADAWRQLRAQIQAASPCTGVAGEAGGAGGQDPAVGRLYDTLPQDLADIALLRWRLFMTAAAIADLMGIEPPAVAASLLTVQRQLSATTLQQLRQHTSRP